MLEEIKKKCYIIIGNNWMSNQRMIAMEECAELIQAISKYERYGESNLSEEIADVLVMIIQLCLMEGIRKEEIEKIMIQKLDRQLERIKNGQ